MTGSTREETRGLGRRALRAIIVCCAAGAVIAGAAWSGSGRRAPSPLDPPGHLFGGLVPLPPGAWSVMNVGDSVEINGMAMRVAHFLVDMEPPEVLEFYLEVFSAEGLDVDGTPLQRDGGGLVAWDHDKGLKRAITVFRQGTGSAVFPSLAAIEPTVTFGSSKRPLPPGPTGSRLVSDVVTRDGGKLSRTVSMMTELGEREATEDLVRRLELAGYRVIPSPGRAGLGHMVEARDRRGRRLVYTLTGGEDGYTAVMLVMEEL